jgi:hypothetical protein
MIDLGSVISFFHGTKWTELAITYEINGVLGENTMSIRRSGNMFGCLSYQRKKQPFPFSPNRKVISILTAALLLVFSEEPFLSVRQIATPTTF